MGILVSSCWLVCAGVETIWNSVADERPNHESRALDSSTHSSLGYRSGSPGLFFGVSDCEGHFGDHGLRGWFCGRLDGRSLFGSRSRRNCVGFCAAGRGYRQRSMRLVVLLGIFLLGASAGVVVAGAAFAGMGHEAQPIFLLVSAVAFGLLALALQKFMIIVSSAFSGSYLIAAGLLHLAYLGRDTAPLWFGEVQKGWAEIMVYVALFFCIYPGLNEAAWALAAGFASKVIPLYTGLSGIY